MNSCSLQQCRWDLVCFVLLHWLQVPGSVQGASLLRPWLVCAPVLGGPRTAG